MDKDLQTGNAYENEGEKDKKIRLWKCAKRNKE
jgi:hypothetical protein